MSGEEELKTAQQRLAEVDAALDNYEKTIGVDKINASNGEYEQYLDLPTEVLRKYSDEQCGIAAYCLARYAAYVQRAYNIEEARHKWAEQNLKIAIADQLSNYEYCSFEDKKLRAIKDNEYAMKLEKIKIYAEGRATRLSFLASRIDVMARTLLELQQSKRRYKNG